jgi:hypothetical protein
VSRTPLPISFRVDQRPVSGETLALDAGDRILVLTSCSADLGLELQATYITGHREDDVLVGECWAIGAEESEPVSRYLPTSEESIADPRPACLYDHLQRLIDLASEAGYELGFEGVDGAVAHLNPTSV